jgi:hypothetical protein
MAPVPETGGEEMWRAWVDIVVCVELEENTCEDAEEEGKLGRITTGIDVGLTTDGAWLEIETDDVVSGQMVVETDTIWVVILVLFAGQFVTLEWQEMIVWVSVA